MLYYSRCTLAFIIVEQEFMVFSVTSLSQPLVTPVTLQYLLIGYSTVQSVLLVFSMYLMIEPSNVVATQEHGFEFSAAV